MPVIVKTVLKDFNAALLIEQIPGGILESIGWAGFIKPSPRSRIFTPAAARRQIGYSSNTGPDFADPGEIRFTVSREIDSQEEAQLDAILDAHDATQLTAEQQRQDQDEADLDAILATERDAFIAALQTMQAATSAIDAALTGWDQANQASTKQKTEDSVVAARDAIVAIRASLLTVGKLMRFILRRERGAAI